MKEAGAQLRKFVKNSELTAGSSFKGIYLKQAIDEKYKKLEFHIRGEDGQVTVLKNSGNLARRMEEVPVGSLVLITNEGKSPMKSGPFKGTPAHQWKVLYDVPTGTPSSAAPIASAAAPEALEDAADDGGEEEPLF